MSAGRPLLLDVTRLTWRRWVGRLPTGIDRVCLAYLDRYRDQSQAVIQRRGYRRILTEAGSERLFEILATPGRDFRTRLVSILVREQLARFLPCSGSGRLYLNIGHTGLNDPGYLSWTQSSAVRPVYMIHDLIPITHPQYCRAGEAPRHERRVQHMLASAAGIIGNSQDTIDHLARFARSEGLDLPPVLASLLGSDSSLSSTEPRPRRPARPLFVVLGTIEARKNHAMLLRIWKRLVQAQGRSAPRLLIIGQRGWECEDVFDILDRDEGLRDAVREVSQCSDAELQQHLANATALLFPSLAEGYGLPLVEALGAGTPVIASDLPVFHEIAPGVPEFLDPLDSATWEAAILDFAREGSAIRQAQIERLSRYRPPSWNDHFARVDSWLATL